VSGLESGTEGRAFPGEELVARVTGQGGRDWFFDSGRRSVQETAAVLGLVGRGFADYERILDFGAGCGRMLTWLDDVAAAGRELYATDIDADAIAWIAGHLPFATAQTNDALPPLRYPDGFFDLVYNHSVFSHLDEYMQDAWLGELRRVTRPGAQLVLTVHGEHAFAQYEDARRGAGQDTRRAAFDARGIVFMPDPHWQQSFPAWYGGTYHATWYVFAHWSRWFRIRAYVPLGALGFQDMVLLERREDGEDPYLRAGSAAGAPELTAAAQALLARGPDLLSRSRFGVAGSAWRRALSVLLRNFSVYQRQVDEALIEALRELERRIR
jgi:SAM-dependent methyltransferase